MKAVVKSGHRCLEHIDIFAIVNIFMGGVTVILLPLLAETRFAGASSLGWLLSGGALSAVVLSQLGKLRHRGLFAYLGVAVPGLALAGLAFAPQIGWGVAAMAVGGGSIMVFGVVWETTMQELVPGEVLGRVVSTYMLGSFALLPLGFCPRGILPKVSALVK